MVKVERTFPEPASLEMEAKKAFGRYDNLEAMKKNPNSKVIMRKLKALLRRESKFAAFKRNYIRENKKEYPQLVSYIS